MCVRCVCVCWKGMLSWEGTGLGKIGEVSPTPIEVGG